MTELQVLEVMFVEGEEEDVFEALEEWEVLEEDLVALEAWLEVAW